MRVAERSEEVGEIIPAPHHPWAGQDAREGVLDQVLGLVVRPAERERDSVEDGAMGNQCSWVEDACLVGIRGPVLTGPG